MKYNPIKKMAGMFLLVVTFLATYNCFLIDSTKPPQKPRMSLFVGVDISGSFLRGPHFKDALNLLATYIYTHLNGFGRSEVPNALFVGSIGGAKLGEPKTFYPIQTFQDKSIRQIKDQLLAIFPPNKQNPITDFNAFFEQIAELVKSKNLILRPVTILMISDGEPDFAGVKGIAAFRKIELTPLERLSRNITLRLLYTDAVTGMNWRTKIKRKRVKIWSQDAPVMSLWKEPGILKPNVPFKKQTKFFGWLKDNVDFGVRTKRVD